MIARLVAAAALAAPALLGQFVFEVDGRPAGEVVDLGTVAAGDVLSTTVAVRNASTASATLATISVAEKGFSLGVGSALPQVLKSGESLLLRLSFRADQPATYSAVLRASGVSTLVIVKVVRSLAVFLEQDSSLRELNSSTAAEFGSVDRDDRRVLRLVVQNPTAAPLPVTATVAGKGFRAMNGGPASLGAGESASLEVAFEPGLAEVGVQTGQLTVDRRHIPLLATGVEPPKPLPQVVIERKEDRLARLQVRLSFAARASGSGRVELDLRPLAAGAGEPALLFPAVNNRLATFQFARGDSSVRFATGEWIELQVGTTAGTILATALVSEGDSNQGSLVIAPEVVGIDSATALRLAGSLEVTVTGFDNSRTAGPLSFTFFDGAGNAIPPGAIRLDAKEDFQAFFGVSPLGGVFKLRAVFPVNGNPAEVAAVETEFSNVAGSSKLRKQFE